MSEVEKCEHGKLLVHGVYSCPNCWTTKVELLQARIAALELALRRMIVTFADKRNEGKPQSFACYKAEETISGSKLGELFQALLELDNARDDDYAPPELNKKVEALRKECGL